MTIIEELEQIAKACKTSEEFTNRAKDYMVRCKGIKQPIFIDSQIRDIFRKVEKERLINEGWDKYTKVIKPALHERPDCSGHWYEVWVDLDEDWDEMWLRTFRFLGDNEIVEACAKYINERSRFYDSPDYYDMLDKLVAGAFKD